MPLQVFCVFPLSVQQKQTAVYKSPFWAAINEETEALLSHYVFIPEEEADKLQTMHLSNSTDIWLHVRYCNQRSKHEEKQQQRLQTFLG